MTGAEGEMENKRRARQGFTLVALMVMLAVAAVIMMSPEYIGKARRDAEIQLTERVTRDLASLAEAIRQRHILHMKYRSDLVAGVGGVTAQMITDLWSSANWSSANVKALLDTFPGIGTIKFSGNGTDLAAPPTIVTSVLNNETLSTGHIIPSTISVNITVTTNRPMYAHAIRDARNRFMKSSYITNVNFDFDTKKSLQITVLVGQGGTAFGPVL
jgi:type II secretory pathway pseudopilin PulG